MEKKKLILLLLSCAVITEAHAAYQGRVYVDSNRNGIYDKGEKVLKGIRVSDGLNVVKRMPKEYMHFPDTNGNDLSSSPLLPAIGQTINITGVSTAQGKHTISACNPGKDASSQMAVTGSSIFPIPRYSIRKTKKTGRITSGIMRLTRISHLSSIPVISAMKMD